MLYETADAICKSFMKRWVPLLDGRKLNGGAKVLVYGWPYQNEEQPGDYFPVTGFAWTPLIGDRQYGQTIQVSDEDLPPEHILALLQEGYDKARETYG